MQNQKKVYIAIAIIAVIIIAIVVSNTRNKNAGSGPVTMKTYAEPDFGIQVTYPSNWDLNDNLTPNTCCLFVTFNTIATTTAMNASGTPVTSVTATERAKLQIGYYETKMYDPFKAASTTPVTLGGTTFYKGMTRDTEFYLLPRSPTEGVGIAMFAYASTTAEQIKEARDIVATIKLLPRAPVITSTSTTSTKASKK